MNFCSTTFILNSTSTISIDTKKAYRALFVLRGYGPHALTQLYSSYTLSFSSSQKGLNSDEQPLHRHDSNTNTMDATKEYLSVYSGANGNNDVWFNQLRDSVLAIGALDLTEDDYTPPDPQGTSAAAVARYEAHNKRSQQFRAVVNRACGPELGNHIIGDLTNPRDIWQRIIVL